MLINNHIKKIVFGMLVVLGIVFYLYINNKKIEGITINQKANVLSGEVLGAYDLVLQEGTSYGGTRDKTLHYSSSASTQSLLLSGPGSINFAIKFDLSHIPVGTVIQSAKISLYYSADNSNETGTHSKTITSYRLLKDWDESTANQTQRSDGNNWTSSYARSAGNDRSVSVSASQTWSTGQFGWKSFDITSDITDMVKNPSSNFGWVFDISTDYDVNFHSSEYSDATFRPKLEITYVADTAVPAPPIPVTPPPTPPPATGGGTSTPPPSGPDVTPPTITAISVSEQTSFSSKINWTTNENSDSQIEYGLNTSYGNNTILNSALIKTHSENITGLSAGTTYNFRIKSRDAAGNLAVSDNFTFITPQPSVSADVFGAHPRIWFTADSLEKLRARAAANDPDWLLVKAGADKVALRSELDYRTVSVGDITYGEYYNRLLTLAFAYIVSGDVNYFNKAVLILEDLDEGGLCFLKSTGAASATTDPCGRGLGNGNGYSYRFHGMALAIGYDWLYDRFTLDQKTRYATQINEFLDYYNANGYQRNGPGYGNFFSGYFLPLGLSGIATAGDNPRAQEWIDMADSKFNSLILPLYRPGGLFYGGDQVEGWAYGDGTATRYMHYLLALKTATGQEPPELKSFAYQSMQALIYGTKPNRSQLIDDGEWGGDYSGVPIWGAPLIANGALYGTQEGRYSQYYLNNLIPRGYKKPEIWQFMFNDSSNPQTNYTLSFPLTYFSEGSSHFLMRSDWTDSAVWANFKAGATHFADHESRDGGAFTIQRGNDYLIVDGGQFVQPNGWVGSGAGGTTSNLENTLYFNDFGEYLIFHRDYAGGQGFWASGNKIDAYEYNNVYAYVRSDLTKAYDTTTNKQNPALTTLKNFTRSFVFVRPNTFVIFDRVKSSKASHEKKFRLHFARQPVLNGDTLESTFGASKVFVKALLPENPKITFSTNNTGTGAVRTYISDTETSVPATDVSFLNVVFPTDSTGSIPFIEKVVSANENMSGAFVNSSSPYLVMFSSDGEHQSSVTYSVNYPASTVVKHLLVDIQPGTYDIFKNSVKILSGVTASSKGVLSFESSGGSTFQIVQTGQTPASPSSTLPSISSFSAYPNYIGLGQPSTLSWSVTGATSLSITPGVGTVTGTSKSVSPVVTTTYTLSATNALGTSTRTVMVNVGTTSTSTQVTLPVISSIATPVVSTSTATITWNTDVNTDTQVEYGLTTSYGSSSVLKDSTTKVKSHSVTLTGLTPGVRYNFRVKSRDADGNLALSINQSFTTSLVINNTVIVPSVPVVTQASTPGGAVVSQTANTKIVTTGSSDIRQNTTDQTKTTYVNSKNLNLKPIYQNLFRGSKVSDVVSLQNVLIKEALLSADSNTGFFGSLTEEAVKAFQRKYGIVSSGSPSDTGYGAVGPKTRAKINELLGITPSTGGGKATTQAPSNYSVQTKLIKPLFRGLKGSDVVALQNVLIKEGFLSPGNNTGFFGPLTETALKAFQKKYNIVISGTASTTGFGATGPKTRAKINELAGY